MNCSNSIQIENQSFLPGNLGALMFMTVYIGIYGFGIIVYFTWQFMNDSKDRRADEISTEFFTNFHHINQRQDIYNQLTNQNWLRKAYKIYYSEQYIKNDFIDEKVNHCVKKYSQQLEYLRSKHMYYVTEQSIPSPALTSFVQIES